MKLNPITVKTHALFDYIIIFNVADREYIPHALRFEIKLDKPLLWRIEH
jgi:hypothetical protein